MKILANLDLVKNQIINHVLHVVAGTPSSPVEGQVWYDTTANRLKYRDDGGNDRLPWTADGDIPAGQISNGKLATNPLARTNHTGTQTASTISDLAATVQAYSLDLFADAAADVALGGFKITGLGTPSASTDAATKGYVDTAVTGLSWKAPVKVATTAAGTLATSFENGDTVDGVALVTGDRILVKDQAAPAENGIYTVNASGAPTRATDADSSAELQGAAVMVQQGTTNANTQWIQTTDGTITLGTTAVVFTQFGGSSTYTAGDGLTLTGNDFDVNLGAGLEFSGDDIVVDTDVVVRKFAANVGNGSLTTITVTHNLNTLDVQVQIVEVSTGETVLADVVRTGVNAVDLVFAVAPTTNQYRAVIQG